MGSPGSPPRLTFTLSTSGPLMAPVRSTRKRTSRVTLCRSPGAASTSGQKLSISTGLWKMSLWKRFCTKATCEGRGVSSHPLASQCNSHQGLPHRHPPLNPSHSHAHSPASPRCRPSWLSARSPGGSGCVPHTPGTSWCLPPSPGGAGGVLQALTLAPRFGGIPIHPPRTRRTCGPYRRGRG